MRATRWSSWTTRGRRRSISARSTTASMSSVHAATKYIGGHSDVLLGTHRRQRGDVSGAASAVDRHGASPRPSDDCFLGLRGLRTLASRASHTAAGERHRGSLSGCATRPGGERGHLSGAARRRAAMNCGSAISRGATSLFGVVLQPGRRRRASTRCSTACASSAWAGAGAASKASSSRPIRNARAR